MSEQKEENTKSNYITLFKSLMLSGCLFTCNQTINILIVLTLLILISMISSKQIQPNRILTLLQYKEILEIDNKFSVTL